LYSGAADESRVTRFRFAKDNDVVLVDEFDQTFTDVLPFWALSPSVLHQRASRLEVDPSTFTMVIRKGKVEIAGAHAKDGRAKDQAELMKRWAKWVPDVNITMSAHDGPSIMMDHGTRQKHLDHAKAGKRATLSFPRLVAVLSRSRRLSTVIPDAEADNVDEDAACAAFLRRRLASYADPSALAASGASRSPARPIPGCVERTTASRSTRSRTDLASSPTTSRR
jgi:hypothetical protein